MFFVKYLSQKIFPSKNNHLDELKAIFLDFSNLVRSLFRGQFVVWLHCTGKKWDRVDFDKNFHWGGNLPHLDKIWLTHKHEIKFLVEFIWNLHRVFFLEGQSPPYGKNFVNPPSDTCPRFWTKACPPPAEVRPQKFEKFKYIFVANLTTFKLKSTLKSSFHA